MDSNKLKKPGTYVLSYQNEVASCVYKKQEIQWEHSNIPIWYVGSILFIGNGIPNLQSVETWLSKCFSMKDLGETAYILN